jgi:hypothetical protein
MSPYLIEKKIHCPERCKQISCHHILTWYLFTSFRTMYFFFNKIWWHDICLHLSGQCIFFLNKMWWHDICNIMSPYLIEKKIHCPERCKQISCHHILLKKKYIVLKDVNKYHVTTSYWEKKYIVLKDVQDNVFFFSIRCGDMIFVYIFQDNVFVFQ